MRPTPSNTITLDYARARPRRRLDQVIDVELWAAVGVVVALLVVDVGCIVLILLRG